MDRHHEGDRNNAKKFDKCKKKKKQQETGPPKPAKVFIDPSPNWTKLQEMLGLGKKRKKKNKCKEEGAAKKRKVEAAAPSRTGDSNSKLWFELKDVHLQTKPADNPQSKPAASGEQPRLTRVVALDCEMVGVGYGGKDSVLARVSIVNELGQCVYDTYVKTIERITDYRTHVSGVTYNNIKSGKPFFTVQKEVANILEGRIIVGHALKNDFKVLFLSYPWFLLRDTSKYKPFRKLIGGGTPSLKKLAYEILSLTIQQGEHCSVQDAAAAMKLYMLHSKEWEKSLPTRTRKWMPKNK